MENKIDILLKQNELLLRKITSLEEEVSGLTRLVKSLACDEHAKLDRIEYLSRMRQS